MNRLAVDVGGDVTILARLPMPDSVIAMDVVRRLAVVSARISSASDLTTTLQAVADGVVDVVGFGMAVVNHRLSSGDLAVVAVTGPNDVKAALMGKVYPRAAMDRLLARSDAWGSLRFNPQDRFEDDAVPQWVPDTPATDDPDAWQPWDMLLAPMWADDGDLIGVISVHEPTWRETSVATGVRAVGDLRVASEYRDRRRRAAAAFHHRTRVT